MRRWVSMWLVLIAVLPAGCTSIGNKARLEVFEATARSFGRAIRWSEFENAYGFVRPSSGIPVPDFNRLKGIRVTNYDDVGVKMLPDGNTVEQVIRVQYVHVNRMSERSLTAIQRWTYDEENKRWFLVKGFPDFR